MKPYIAAGLLVLASCGGGGGNNTPPPTPQNTVTITDPMNYFGTIQASDPWTTERWDIGHYQAVQTFITGSNTATTIWSYPPFGRFVAANGDGGETYVLNGDTAYATSTQDGSQPGITQFGTAWPVFDVYAPQCPAVKAVTNGRECMQQMIFSGTPSDITANTVMLDHDDSPTVVERFYFAENIGRVVWEAWQQGPCINPNGLNGRTGSISYEPPPYPGWVKCDERQNTNYGPAQPGLSGASFGWP